MSDDAEMLPPPNNPEEFESLCLELWRLLLKDSGAQKNGRSGQPQAGVDVFGRTEASCWVGIQCKQKNHLLWTKVTVAELRSEVHKALKFKPPLSKFILATSGPTDVTVQKQARMLTDKHAKTGKFSVEVWSWQDIWRILHKNIATHPEFISKYWPSVYNTVNQLKSNSKELEQKLALVSKLQIWGASYLRRLEQIKFGIKVSELTTMEGLGLPDLLPVVDSLDWYLDAIGRHITEDNTQLVILLNQTNSAIVDANNARSQIETKSHLDLKRQHVKLFKILIQGLELKLSLFQAHLQKMFPEFISAIKEVEERCRLIETKQPKFREQPALELVTLAGAPLRSISCSSLMASFPSPNTLPLCGISSVGGTLYGDSCSDPHYYAKLAKYAEQILNLDTFSFGIENLTSISMEDINVHLTMPDDMYGLAPIDLPEQPVKTILSGLPHPDQWGRIVSNTPQATSNSNNSILVIKVGQLNPGLRKSFSRVAYIGCTRSGKRKISGFITAKNLSPIPISLLISFKLTEYKAPGHFFSD